MPAYIRYTQDGYGVRDLTATKIYIYTRSDKKDQLYTCTVSDLFGADKEVAN